MIRIRMNYIFIEILKFFVFIKFVQQKKKNSQGKNNNTLDNLFSISVMDFHYPVTNRIHEYVLFHR